MYAFTAQGSDFARQEVKSLQMVCREAEVWLEGAYPELFTRWWDL